MLPVLDGSWCLAGQPPRLGLVRDPEKIYHNSIGCAADNLFEHRRYVRMELLSGPPDLKSSCDRPKAHPMDTSTCDCPVGIAVKSLVA